MSEEKEQNAELESIYKSGGLEMDSGIHCLSIIGQIEGHYALGEGQKATKYEHLIPLLVSIEESREVKGLLLILNSYAQFMENCGVLAGQYYQRRLGNPDIASLDPTHYIHALLEDCFAQAKEQGYWIPNNDPTWMADFCYCHFRGVVIDWLLRKRAYPLRERMMEEFKLFEGIFRKE